MSEVVAAETGSGDSMTGSGFAWRLTALTFIVLSMVFVVAGLVVVQFDEQYSVDAVPERTMVGVFGGLYGAALLSPITLVVSVIVGVCGGIVHARRSARSAAAP
jgi:hypothetical protein